MMMFTEKELSGESAIEACAVAQARIPAELGVWLFILLDMCIFALYFWVYLWDKSAHPDQFLLGQATLDQNFGALNTVLLLTSSYFAAAAVRAARVGDLKVYRLNIKLTMTLGVGFLAVKTIEYSQKFEAGLHIATNEFYRYYFAFTGLHLVHVIIGLSFLSYLLFSIRTPEQLRAKIPSVEGGGLYWHMVDLLWIVLFTLIYLVP